MLVAGLGPCADISAAYGGVEHYSLDFGQGGAYALGFVVACGALLGWCSYGVGLSLLC